MSETPANANAWAAADTFLTPRRFAAIMAALVLIQFPGVALGLQTFFFRDFALFGFPLAAYHRQAFWSGEIPLWDPYNYAGLPFLAQWNTMVLYPGSLLYLLPPLTWGLPVFCLAHQWLAGVGMYFLGRRSAQSNLAGAVAGIAYAFGGLLLSSLKWPNNIAAFGWMPFVVLTCWRVFELRTWKSIGIAALVGSMQMLTGAPEAVFLTWIVVGALALGETFSQRYPRPLFSLAAVVLLVSLICAAQLLPFLDLLKLSQRSQHFGSSEWAMPIWGWANFFLPLFGTFPSYHGVPAQPDQYWISTYYVSLGALALAVVSLKQCWRAALMFTIAMLAAIVALGDPAYLYKLLRTAVPAMGFMRFPIKFVILPCFVFPWLAAFGVTAIRDRTIQFRSFAIAANTCAVICFALLFVPAPFHPTQAKDILAINGLERLICISLCIWAFSRFHRAEKVTASIVAIVICLWVDSRTQAPEQNPTVANWVYESGVAQLTNAPTLGHGRAMIEPLAQLKLNATMTEGAAEDVTLTRMSLFANANLIDRIPKTDGFFSLELRESADLINLVLATTNQSFAGIEKALAVSHRTAPGKTFDWISQPTNQPWITGGQQPIFASRGDIIRTMAGDSFDPSKTVLIESTSASTQRFATNVVISDVHWSPQHVDFNAQCAEESWVVISQAFHPAWRASINGQPLPIIRADHFLQALRIPKGGGHVEVKYIDAKFRLGCALSALGLVAALAMTIGPLARTRRQG